MNTLEVSRLIIEEDVGANGLENRRLVQAVHEKEFSGAHAESLECRYKAFFAVSTARGNDGDSDGGLEVGVALAAALVVESLEFGKLREEIHQGTRGMRRLRIFEFELLEGLESLLLILALRNVVCEHAVEVEGNSQRLVVLVSVEHLPGQYKASGEARIDGAGDVLSVGREKEGYAEGGDVGQRGLPGSEGACVDGQVVVPAGIEEAPGRHGRIAGERYDAEGFEVGEVLVQADQALDEGEGDAGLEGIVAVGHLIIAESVVALL